MIVSTSAYDLKVVYGGKQDRRHSLFEGWYCETIMKGKTLKKYCDQSYDEFTTNYTSYVYVTTCEYKSPVLTE